MNNIITPDTCKLEICCTSGDDVAAALAGGADRAELCTALSAEGVTPSAGCISEALRAARGMALTVLIRPREGDFVYTPADVRAMVADIHAARQLGAAGVTIGALTAEGSVDIEAMRALIQAATPQMEITFSRAIDVSSNPGEALEALIALGCKRVLTSGGAPSSIKGVAAIAALTAQAAGRIDIMPAGGVRPDNIATLRRLTGARQFHSSARAGAGATVATGLFGPRPAAVDTNIVKSLKQQLTQP